MANDWLNSRGLSTHWEIIDSTANPPYRIITSNPGVLVFVLNAVGFDPNAPSFTDDVPKKKKAKIQGLGPTTTPSKKIKPTPYGVKTAKTTYSGITFNGDGTISTG